MWKNNNRKVYVKLVADLLADPDVLSLQELDQHNKHASRLDHCLYVSYLSFLWCRRLKLDHVAAARAGLLHDFHFGGTEDGVKRLWKHPHTALENAQQRYKLSDMEKDIIVKHMWPLTPQKPRYRESFMVSMADKVCALMEMTRLYRAFRVKKHLTLQPAAA